MIAKRKKQHGNLLEVTVLFPALCIAIVVFAVEAYRAFSAQSPPGGFFIAVLLLISLGIGVLGSMGVGVGNRTEVAVSVFWGVLALVVTVVGLIALRSHQGWRLIAFEAIAVLPLVVFVFLLISAIGRRKRGKNAA